MQRVEVKFTHGLLRQPGLWGKVLLPNGSMYPFEDEKDYDLTVEKTTRTLVLPALPEGAYLVFGAKGFHTAGQLASFFILLKVTADQAFEHQFAGHLARFEGKNVLLQTLSETDMKPVYEALTNAKYAHLDRLKSFLRREGVDKTKD